MRTAVIYNYLIEATLIASIAIVLMAVVRRFLRRYIGNAAILFAWLLVAVRLLCPISLPNPVIRHIDPLFGDPAVRPIASQVQLRLKDAATELIADAQTALQDQKSGQARNLDFALGELDRQLNNGGVSAWGLRVYGAGAAAVCLWFALANLRFGRRLRRDRIEPISGALKERYAAICKARGVKKPIPVYLVDPIPSACLVGVFRPYIALPLTADLDQATAMLTHEVCHYRGHDHWWGLLRLACCAAYWFDPLVWLAAGMSSTDIELRCDERVTDGMDEGQRRAYADTLMAAAVRRYAPGRGVLATGMTMTGRRLKSRIESVLRGGKGIRALAVAFAATASVLLVCAFATSLPGSAEMAQSPAGDTLPAEYSVASARARQVWASEWYAYPDADSWEYFTEIDPDLGYWSQYATDAEGCVRRVVSDAEGAVHNVEDRWVYGAWTAIDPAVFTEADIAAAQAYLTGYFAYMDPTLRIAAVEAGEAGQLGEETFLTLFVLPQDETRPSLAVTLRMAPDLRVCYFTDADVGNG